MFMKDKLKMAKDMDMENILQIVDPFMMEIFMRVNG